MKILVVHNRYQHRGGEDAVQEAETNLLRQAGHQVIEYIRDNEEIQSCSAYEKASLAWRATWSRRTYRELLEILSGESPDLVHFHNTFPLISPSAYYACRVAETPVVQTLHNYRLLCPAGTFFRDNHVCEECVSHSLLRSVAHGCYRESRPASAVAASVLGVHRLMHTWSNQIDLFFVCSEFARRKFIDAGFDAGRIRVKPNFIADSPVSAQELGSFALYLGRLSEEKGPQLLLRAWSCLRDQVPLRVAGDGPLFFSLRAECARMGLSHVVFTDWIPATAARDTLRSARFLIVPSLCYEGFPMVVAEACACGIPVIAAGHGGLAEIVRDGYTGLHFAPGDPIDLARKVLWAWTHPAETAAMGAAARFEFEQKYTAPAALCHLEDGYGFVLRQPRRPRARPIAFLSLRGAGTVQPNKKIPMQKIAQRRKTW
ncbi:MAG TPA: glycosyltransferase family 4 protein [Candidatus Acidoferrum sp.]|nr:glycosyltransferase family 4 protein [Candidatus Acidoferrum sp.]